MKGEVKEIIGSLRIDFTTGDSTESGLRAMTK
jgi:hypothetical protein